jgi:hypothetical protein
MTNEMPSRTPSEKLKETNYDLYFEIEDLLSDPDQSGLYGEALTDALIESTKELPWAAMMYAQNYIHYIPEDQRADLLADAMEEDPINALIYKDNYIENIPAQLQAALLEKAKDTVAANNTRRPHIALEDTETLDI